MFLPKFSVRWLLLLTTLFAFLFYLISMAGRGSDGALAVVIALTALVVPFGLYAIVFILAFGLASIDRLRRGPQTESPFATEAMPKQILPPDDPD